MNFITENKDQTMKYISFIIALVFILAGPKANSQQAEQDATYQKLIREYTLHNDGSYDFREYKELRLNSHFAFHRLFGETFIIYNPEKQDLKINESYTTMADGTRVEAPENAFNELLPRFAREARAYNHLREMAITHTGLEVGATIYLDYTLSTEGGFMPFFMGKEEVRQNVPVEEMEVIVRVPEDLSLKYRVLNIRTAPDIFEENGQMVYRWSFRNIRAQTGEKYAPSEEEPVLFFSLFDLQRAFFSFVNQDAFRHNLPAEVASKAVELSKQQDDEVKLIWEARKWLTERLQHKEIPLKYSGFAVRDLPEVWESTYAGNLEMAIMLSDMLVKAGINAYPVAGIHNSRFGRQLGNMEMFGEYLVQVNPKKEGRFYLSPHSANGENMIWEVADMTFIQLDGAIESVRTFEEKEYMAEAAMDAVLRIPDTANLLGEVTLEVTNGWTPYMKVYNNKKQAGAPLNVKVDNEKVSVEKISGPEMEAVLPFEDPSAARQVQDFLLVRLPSFKYGVDQWELGSLPTDRIEPLELPYPVSEKYTYEIALANGWQALGKEVELEREKEFGSAKLVVRPKSNSVVIERHITLDKKRFTPGEYADLLELIEVWDLKRGRELILKTAGSSD